MSKWSFDPAHSRVGFVVRHMMLAKMHGRFNRWSGNATLPDSGLDGAAVTAEIDVASIDTHEAQRDKHLRSEEFFDVAHHPTMTFRSSRIEGSGPRFRLHGELTIRGVTRPITLEVEDGGVGRDPWGHMRRGFTARGRIERSAYGLTWNQALEAGGVLVGNEVQLEIDVQLVKSD
jgi:polyisoprenoid-binding protein YceI